MKRHLLTLGLMATLSSFALGQQSSHDSQPRTSNSSSPRLLAMLAGHDQERATGVDNHHLSKKEKKAREKQRKEDEKRRKKEAREQEKQFKEQQKKEAKDREKQLKEQQKQDSRLRDKGRKGDDKQIAKAQKQEREHERKERDKDLKKAAEQESRAQRASAAPAPPPPNSDLDRTRDRDRETVRAREENRDRDRVRDHDREMARRDQDRDRDDRETAARDHDHDRDRDRETAARDHDRDRDRARDHDREIARTREEDRYRRDYDREMAYRRRLPVIPVSHAADAGALRAQRNVSRAIYSQLPDSNVMVLLNNSNQIVLRGAAPSPSFRQRLMQLAGAAAGGYSLVDQLASEAVSSVAGTATSAAIGGVSDLIHHGSGSSDHGDSGSAPAYSRQEPSSSQTPSPPSGSSGPDFAANAPAGSSACVNVYNNNQVQLTGRAVSATDADRMRQFARQIAGSAATIDDQLATRINGVYSSANPAESTPATPGANAASRGSAVTPGSVVCLNMDNSNSVLLTGTVGSAADLSAVEQSVQSLLGNPRLLDQLNVGAIDAGSRVAATGGTSGLATSTTAGADAPRTAANAAIASPSQPLGTAASGTTTPAAASDLEQALHSIPRLSNVDAELTANSVRLSGSVNTPDDQQTAREIARQYAPGREILDNLTVAARDQGQVP